MYKIAKKRLSSINRVAMPSRNSSAFEKLADTTRTFYYSYELTGIFCRALKACFEELDFTEFVLDETEMTWQFYDEPTKVRFAFADVTSNASYPGKMLFEVEGGWFFDRTSTSYGVVDMGGPFVYGGSNTSYDLEIEMDMIVTNIGNAFSVHLVDADGNVNIAFILTRGRRYMDGNIVPIILTNMNAQEFVSDNTQASGYRREYANVGYCNSGWDYSFPYAVDGKKGWPVRCNYRIESICPARYPDAYLNGKIVLLPCVDNFCTVDLAGSNLVYVPRLLAQPGEVLYLSDIKKHLVKITSSIYFAG